MEGVYDHIAEDALPRSPSPSDPKEHPALEDPEGDLSTDLQETYRSFAASPWGAKLGGFLGTVRKQGGTYISEARKQGESVVNEARTEATQASQDAWGAWTDLRQSLAGHARTVSGGAAEMLSPTAATSAEGSKEGESSKDAAAAAVTGPSEGATFPDAHDPTAAVSAPPAPRTASEAAMESEGLIARFRAEAEKRLKDIQRAEDAADEALLRFGTNIRNFLRDAVTVAPPSEGDLATPGEAGKVLFESKDAEGRKVIHTSRFDAQLHVIHCALESFTRDPSSPEWAKFKEEFDIDAKTDVIATDLKKYDELRRAMEKLVPEQVDYATFWARYYFLRMVIESEEKRRKEMLKGATLSTEEDVAWDEDSDSDSEKKKQSGGANTPHAVSTTNLSPPETKEGRTSQDQASTAGSDASYDLVSGATSRAAGSPKEEKGSKLGKVDERRAGEDSEDDWE